MIKTIEYSEIFGAGYSFDFSKHFSAGFSLRYFIQKSNEDLPLFISDTTLNTITIINEEKKTKSQRADIGASYRFNQSARLSVYSINLITANSGDFPEEYLLREEKGAAVQGDFNFGALGLGGVFETNGSFILSSNIYFNLFGADATVFASAFHDKYQEPFFAGITPGLNISFGAF